MLVALISSSHGAVALPPSGLPTNSSNSSRGSNILSMNSSRTFATNILKTPQLLCPLPLGWISFIFNNGGNDGAVILIRCQFLKSIDGCDSQNTKIPDFKPTLVARAIENIVPRSDRYFFLNVKYGHGFIDPLRR